MTARTHGVHAGAEATGQADHRDALMQAVVTARDGGARDPDRPGTRPCSRRRTPHAPVRMALGSMRFAVLPALVATATLLLGGCARKADLTPASSARLDPYHPETGVSEVDGVSAVIEADAWNGRRDVVQHVTPLHVTIQNDGERPLRLRYSEVALISMDGHRYSALPPFEMTGTVDEPVATTTTPVLEPAFGYRGFYVAPYYHPLYPSIDAYAHAFRYDPTYNRHYTTYWRKLFLPTDYMLANALPEGVVEPGGSVSGYLYFERVDPGARRVVFRYDLVNALEGEMFGTLTLPFRVSSASAY
ncbi:MAG: hypothetical protein PVF43_13265 [Candidatus Eiseniibacteriota bacterium]